MPLAKTSGFERTKQPSKLITDFSNISQDDCDEVSPNAVRLDLGKKIQAPREVMLEELSLLNNRGSRMFKMRQQRVERFVYENNPEVFSENSLNSKNLMSRVVGGTAISTNRASVQVKAQGAQVDTSQAAGGVRSVQVMAQVAPVDNSQAAGGANSVYVELQGAQVDTSQDTGRTPGTAGGRGDESTPETSESKHVKTYKSPWERAMRGNEELLATMNVKMPGPHLHHDLSPYKSFNRTALPFGGPDRALQLTVLPPPEAPEPPREPELITTLCDVRQRPSFNRTPVGWMCAGTVGCVHGDGDVQPEDL